MAVMAAVGNLMNPLFRSQVNTLRLDEQYHIRGREEGVEGYVVAGEIARRNSEITALYAIRAGQDF